MNHKQSQLFLNHVLFLKIKQTVTGVTVPLFAVFIALVAGSVILFLSGIHPLHAYQSLIEGSFGSISSFSRTLDKATPLLFSGLAIAFAFKAGLFNIGAQGQLIFGAFAAGVVGASFKSLPSGFHIPVSLFAGAMAGGLYSAIQGFLKAYTGAHEVITGIMLNYVALNFTDYLSSGPYMDRTAGNIVARTPVILESARFPHIHIMPMGFLLAVLVAFLVWWILKYTTWSFAIQTVGMNSHASRYAGIRVRYIVIVTMLFSGMLAGVGGSVETLGIVHRFQPGFNTGLGFEGITIALLGKTHPLGILFASVLFGAMKAGASQMQFSSGAAPELVDVIMAIVLFFVAADFLIRRIVRIKDMDGFKIKLTTGWGSQ